MTPPLDRSWRQSPGEEEHSIAGRQGQGRGTTGTGRTRQVRARAAEGRGVQDRGRKDQTEQHPLQPCREIQDQKQSSHQLGTQSQSLPDEPGPERGDKKRQGYVERQSRQWRAGTGGSNHRLGSRNDREERERAGSNLDPNDGKQAQVAVGYAQVPPLPLRSLQDIDLPVRHRHTSQAGGSHGANGLRNLLVLEQTKMIWGGRGATAQNRQKMSSSWACSPPTMFLAWHTAGSGTAQILEQHGFWYTTATDMPNYERENLLAPMYHWPWYTTGSGSPLALVPRALVQL